MIADLVNCLLIAIVLVGLVLGIVQQHGYTPPTRSTRPDTPKACGGDNDTAFDPWRCPAHWFDGVTVHHCSASYDHPVYDPGSDHVDYLGHRWPQTKPRRRWPIRTRRGHR